MKIGEKICPQRKNWYSRDCLILNKPCPYETLEMCKFYRDIKSTLGLARKIADSPLVGWESYKANPKDR